MLLAMLPRLYRGQEADIVIMKCARPRQASLSWLELNDERAAAGASGSEANLWF